MYSIPIKHLYSFTIAIALLILSGCCTSRPDRACSTGTTSIPPQKNFPALPTPIKAKIEIRGGEYLEKLHPELAHRARLLYERAEAEGIPLRFISGYRRFRSKKKAKKGGSVASWHHFGAAFDLNLVGRKSMKDALKNLKNDRKKWDRVGELAQNLSLTWGFQWGKDEIFHFEWHPGWPEAIRSHTFNKLIRYTGPKVKKYKKVWETFKVHFSSPKKSS